MIAYDHLKISESQAEYGSFKDSMRAPIHRWFMYPAGYSYKFIESKLDEYKLSSGSLIIDPFVGCGTTSVVAKQRGIKSIGIEAHPFVHWVARVKLFWEYDLRALAEAIEQVILNASFSNFSDAVEKISNGEFPALVKKCFSETNLVKLLVIRDTIAQLEAGERLKDFLNLALTHTLRVVSWAGTGWPYIAPSKYHGKSLERDAFSEFYAQCRRMYDDLIWIRANSSQPLIQQDLILGDAREWQPEMAEEDADLVITSPPYLNNYDYADRTRLETYFFGLMKSWRDISEKIRSQLIIAATTQISRSHFNEAQPLDEDLKEASPEVYEQLQAKVEELRRVRSTKGGKKNYDLMVAGYFNDMLKVLKQMLKALKPGGDFVLVVGDSAPYGVYIPTDFYLGRLALGVGFKAFEVELLRHRGGKWAHNSQRHKVGLRESVVTIVK